MYVVRDGICKEPARTWSIICNYVNIMHILMKSTKVQTLAEFGGNIGIFGLKTTFHAYVLGEHTSMKNEL